MGFDVEPLRKGASQIAVAITIAAVLDGIFGSQEFKASMLTGCTGLVILLLCCLTGRKK